MSKKFFEHIIHGGDYNPDQWLEYPDVLKKDITTLKIHDMYQIYEIEDIETNINIREGKESKHRIGV